MNLLTTANGISDNGYITGAGYFNGAIRAYLLDARSVVPEPASLSLLALSGAVLRRRRRTA